MKVKILSVTKRPFWKQLLKVSIKNFEVTVEVDGVKRKIAFCESFDNDPEWIRRAIQNVLLYGNEFGPKNEHLKLANTEFTIEESLEAKKDV